MSAISQSYVLLGCMGVIGDLLLSSLAGLARPGVGASLVISLYRLSRAIVWAGLARWWLAQLRMLIATMSYYYYLSMAPTTAPSSQQYEHSMNCSGA